MSTVDLHVHSNYSDGSDSVEELIAKLIQSGIQTFALTDHDTFDGCTKISELIPQNMKFLKGIELTCTIKHIKCHILGYNYDLEDKKLKALIEKGKQLRHQKLETRIKYLEKEWNIILTKEELDWLYSRKSVVKTHLAHILVKRGLSDTNVNAMKKYLDSCKTGNTRFDGEEAIKIIKDAGGIAIWAHPIGGEGEKHITEEEFTKQFAIMKQFGIQGIECFYSRYNEKECNFLYNFALKNNLFITGGSDYHGTNKENIRIGQLNEKNISVKENKLSILKEIQ